MKENLLQPKVSPFYYKAIIKDIKCKKFHLTGILGFDLMRCMPVICPFKGVFFILWVKVFKNGPNKIWGRQPL